MKNNSEKYVQYAEHFVSDLLIHQFQFNTIFILSQYLLSFFLPYFSFLLFLIRFGDSFLHVLPDGTHLPDDVAQPLLDLSRHGITITPIANSTTSMNENPSILTSSLSILKQSCNMIDPLSILVGANRVKDTSYKKNVKLAADLPSAALDLSNRGGGW